MTIPLEMQETNFYFPWAYNATLRMKENWFRSILKKSGCRSLNIYLIIYLISFRVNAALRSPSGFLKKTTNL